MSKCKGCPFWKWVKADKIYQTPGYHYCEKNELQLVKGGNEMKARILRTNYYAPKLSEGEIVEIIPGMETDAEGIWNAPAGKLVLCRKEDNTFSYASPLDMEIFEYDTVDWSSFRREAAKDIVCSVLAGGIANGANGFDAQKEELVNVSIGVADELIKQLKEE